MSSCEKCWTDSWLDREHGDEGAYSKLLNERTGDLKCTPEEQAGPDAKLCDACNRITLHQITDECMNCHGVIEEQREGPK